MKNDVDLTDALNILIKEYVKSISANKIKSNKENIIIYKIGLAESLCFDYGHFKDLIGIRPDKKYKNKRVYIFKYSDSLNKDLETEIKRFREAKAEKAKQVKEIDTAIKDIEENKDEV